MAVQLGSLAVLSRCAPGHYLVASAVAVELAVLHNFVWHVRYTWREQCDGEGWWRQMMRFHLSNGMVSIVGNLLLMRVLVQKFHVPVLLANVVAIACCSVVNFGLGERWVFAAE
jgi:putative flippase GtrA